MSGVVSDVFSALVLFGLAGGSTGWDIIRRKDMDEHTQDRLVVLSEDGGTAPEMATTSGIGDAALGDPAVLLTVRAGASDSDASAAKAADIILLLHGQRNVVLGSTLYYRIRTRTLEPIFAGFDDKGRPRHTISFQLLRDVGVGHSI